MNAGKICVSICTATAEDLFRKVKAAYGSADLIEIRFDCLEPNEVVEAIKRFETDGTTLDNLLATFRPAEQGGKHPLNIEERRSFWARAENLPFWGRDLEEDLINEPTESSSRALIASHHDFSDVVPDIDSIYEKLKATTATHIKIAIKANSITDPISLWKLIETARADGKHIIPVAMGEAGKWTRILGPSRGAFLTFASPADGAETAPGQISAGDMTEVFRVREIKRETEVYGVIAGDSSYSISPWLHNAAFKATGMNRVFIPLQVDDLDEFVARMVKPETREVELNFRGFSVTNPHKRSIMKYLDAVDETASVIGAVNTVKIENGKLIGFNTDAAGFILPLKELFPDMKGANAAIFGAGGAARACIFALQKEGVNVTIFARDAKKAAALGEEFGVRSRELKTEQQFDGTDILVNTTPLGTKGQSEDISILSIDQLRDVKMVYDLVYNPVETRLIKNAKAAGIPSIGGLEMVIAQGVRQFEIWTGEKAPTDVMAAAVKKKLDL